VGRKTWLSDAVIYQIYPQSFSDSNDDGIGDLRGVINKLDYIMSLGVDAIWFNPCFESPFVDAGYDVADYLKIAPRYGTNEDLEELVEKAGSRGIKVMLDLVAGHTSIEHPWFQKELLASGPSTDGDRYVWTETLPDGWDSDLPGTPAWVKSPGPRKGWYLKNFFDEQPALNFGWVKTDSGEIWKDSVDAPGPRRNVQALKDIMAFWLSRGVAGFRIDMAFSLIKDYDTDLSQRRSAEIWQELRQWLDFAYPKTVLVPEGSEPRNGEPFAFDADFFLVIFKEHSSLFNNQFAGKLPFHEPRPAFFDAAGQGTTKVFTDGWTEIKRQFPDRQIMMSSADHDFNRLACGDRAQEQLGVVLTFLLTWGTVPCIWYGDEIGMKYLPDMPNVEGAICNPDYNRAGCRTPMQWDSSLNSGFSKSERIYLPIDPDENRPTVAAQEADPNSTLNLMRKLTKLRREIPALRTDASVRVVHADYPFAYIRGESHLVILNPAGSAASLELKEVAGLKQLLASGVEVVGSCVDLAPFSYGILELA
jgi:maltose alpha-D-glucosyltransferase/alpha-amylase